jgi:hypothetical protein
VSVEATTLAHWSSSVMNCVFARNSAIQPDVASCVGAGFPLGSLQLSTR